MSETWQERLTKYADAIDVVNNAETHIRTTRAVIAIADAELAEKDATITELQKRLTRVEALHVPWKTAVCSNCGYDWPCPTIEALRQTPDKIVQETK